MLGTRLQPCDIVLLNVPFTDLSVAKQRPFLVLTEATVHGDFTAAQVTSQLHHLVQMVLRDSDCKLGRLPKASIVRPDKVLTLNQSLVVRRVGRLRQPAFERIHTEICRYLGCGKEPRCRE